MLNTNVGDMPIDIFGDYVSDTLGEEWTWEYFVLNLNWLLNFDPDTGLGSFQHGAGVGYSFIGNPQGNGWWKKGNGGNYHIFTCIKYNTGYGNTEI